MVKVRALKNGVWLVARVSIFTYLYGKFWFMVSETFRKTCGLEGFKLVPRWEYKYLR